MASQLEDNLSINQGAAPFSAAEIIVGDSGPINR